MKHSTIPDYRRDTGADAPRRILPRVAVALLGLALAATSAFAGQTERGTWSACITGFVLVVLGVQGFWLPRTKQTQLVAAAWIAVSAFVFALHGSTLVATLVVAAALAAVSLSE